MEGTKQEVQLIAEDGVLYVPSTLEWDQPEGRRMLMQVYDAGDCDVAVWPMRSPKHKRRLSCALYDAREMGLLPIDARAVRLPSGRLFYIDDSL